MKVAVQSQTGPVIADRPIPSPKPTEMLVKVAAASLNRADLAVIAGKAHGSVGGEGSPLGLEWAGEIVEIGAEVQGFAVGDRAMCSGIGGFGEYAVADWRRCFPFPRGDMASEDGACLPIALRTMHNAIKTVGRLKEGQSLLIMGASSGVGIMGLQIARELHAGLVIGTSTKAERRAQLGDFGAHAAINTKDLDWADQVLALTDAQGVDLVVDQLAGPFINDSMRSVRLGGRIVNVGRMAGESGNFDFNLHATRRIEYCGVTFRTRTLDQIHAIAVAVQADLWPALTAGRLTLPIDHRFELGQLHAACEVMLRNDHFGKIVINVL